MVSFFHRVQTIFMLSLSPRKKKKKKKNHNWTPLITLPTDNLVTYPSYVFLMYIFIQPLCHEQDAT